MKIHIINTHINNFSIYLYLLNAYIQVVSIEFYDFLNLYSYVNFINESIYGCVNLCAVNFYDCLLP